jgi:hypothetical protein
MLINPSCSFFPGIGLKIAENEVSLLYNIVKLQKQTDTKGNICVLFGGGAITKIDGTYLV